MSAPDGIRYVTISMPALLRYMRMHARAKKLLDTIYPGDIFIGCEGCETRSCDCDEGVQLVRRLRNELEEVE